MFFGKKPETKEKDQAKIQVLTPNQFISLIEDLHVNAGLKIEETEYLLIQLEKTVMDENEFDPVDEQRRKEMRPLINELMNQLKIDRNLTNLMLHEINFVNTKGTSFFNNERFTNRFSNANKELNETAAKIKELFGKLTSSYPGFLEQQVKVKVYEVTSKVSDLNLGK
jgi:hypothetical protein